MQGIGNDFVVLDGREQSLPLLNWAKIADREKGIGCDQVILLEPSERADVRMRILNADGSEVEACGNATRCIGWLLGTPQGTVETMAGVLTTRHRGEDTVEVEMQAPVIAERSLPIERDPVEVSVGNPHLVFFVPDVLAVDLERFGPEYENHPAFPERTNVEVVQVIDRYTLKMRVWERGVGITQACGTGACAAAAAAIHRGLTEDSVRVEMPGGPLQITWAGDDSSLLMQGAVSLSFRDELDVDNYAACT